ncbi:MAG: MFS transporter [Gammaproteobacteria bacterium]|nr:MFS transporter [Gammaproteobacteria bacterium]MBT4491611.1 MFS transporter [Gammaproteobacteria bacterium]MBT7370807.1 MFS transporter [Gammaproteobacteria bacterium]
MNSGVDGQPRSTLPFVTILNYNLPTAGIGFMFFMVALYLMKFSTDVLLVSPAVMGMIFGISRIWDAVTDPVAGYLSDRTNLKSGRRRPWILCSIPFVCVTFYMMWNPMDGLSESGLIVWMAVAVIGFYTSMTAFTVPHASLGAELSTGYHERTKIFGARHMIWNSGSLLALVAMHRLIVGGNVRFDAYVISLMAAVVVTGLIVWMFITIKERPEFQGRGESNLFVAFGDVIKNRYATLLLIVFFVENLGGAAIGILTPYVAEYVVGRPEKTVIYILMYLIPSVASVPLWVPLSRRIGKKAMWIFSMLVTGFGFGGMFFLEEGSDTMIMVLAFICGLGAGSGAVVAPSIQADIIDYDEYKTGKRKEGTYFAAWNFVFKSASGITLMLTGFVLSLSGFVPNVEQSETTKLALLTLYAIFPLVCYVLGAAIFSQFRLTETEYQKIREALDSRELTD